MMIKLPINTFVTFLFSAALCVAGGEGWLNNLDEGLALAKKEGKPVLAEFTATDYCPPCVLMQKNVFSKNEFIKEASKDYVLVIINSTTISDPELAKKNEKYFVEYGVEKLPTMVLIKPDGKEYERFSAFDYPTVEKFLDRIKKG